jgi:cytidine deaminase
MSTLLKFESVFEVFENENELTIEDQKLLTSSREAQKNAYAPYSNFYVGAALLLENGIIINGNNQENAAYPSGLCAERVAAFQASALHTNIKFVSLAITASSQSKKINFPISPCGSCRQSLLEYELKLKHPIRIILSGDSGKIYISPSVLNLLPYSFNSASL